MENKITLPLLHPNARHWAPVQALHPPNLFHQTATKLVPRCRLVDSIRRSEWLGRSNYCCELIAVSLLILRTQRPPTLQTTEHTLPASRSFCERRSDSLASCRGLSLGDSCVGISCEFGYILDYKYSAIAILRAAHGLAHSCEKWWGRLVRRSKDCSE
jgi:hypothetical protein